MITCDATPDLLYCPGYFPQDLVTIPLEGLLVAGITYSLQPPDKPRWPFAKEVANGTRNQTRQSTALSLGMGAAVLVPFTTKLFADDAGFALWPHMRGFIHAHLLTELLTTSAKVGFGRKRPFYDTEVARHRVRKDDRLSFFSGHSSHAFAFATYGSYLSRTYLRDSAAGWVFTGLFYATSTWIGASRAVDGQHNWSDVVVGALVGTGVAYFVADRVDRVTPRDVDVSIGPGTVSVSYTLR